MLSSATDLNQFTEGSFKNLASVVVSDTSISVTLLNNSISNAKIATNATGDSMPTITIFSLIYTKATITNGDEGSFSTLLEHVNSGSINITGQDLHVNQGTISEYTLQELLFVIQTGSVTATLEGENEDVHTLSSLN